MASPASTRPARTGLTLVTGSTGNVGKPLVEALLADGRQVRALIQPGHDAPWPAHDALELVTVDLADRDGLVEAADGAEGVFMLVPPGHDQVRWQRHVLQAARHARRVVKLSAFDTGPDSPWTLGRWHWTGEQELRESGLSHAVLRPQYFVQNLLRDEAALRGGTMRTFIPPQRPVGVVDARDVGEVAAALLIGDEHEGEVLVPTGPAAVTPAEIARTIGEIIGTRMAVEYVDPFSAIEVLEAAGVPAWLAEDTMRICQDASAQVTDVVERVLGRPARTVDDAVRARFA